MSKNTDLIRDAVVFTVTLALIMAWENPALRQAVTMRVSLYGKRVCQARADWWQNAALKCAQTYNRARL